MSSPAHLYPSLIASAIWFLILFITGFFLRPTCKELSFRQPPSLGCLALYLIKYSSLGFSLRLGFWIRSLYIRCMWIFSLFVVKAGLLWIAQVPALVLPTIFWTMLRAILMFSSWLSSQGSAIISCLKTTPFLLSNLSAASKNSLPFLAHDGRLKSSVATSSCLIFSPEKDFSLAI